MTRAIRPSHRPVHTLQMALLGRRAATVLATGVLLILAAYHASGIHQAKAQSPAPVWTVDQGASALTFTASQMGAPVSGRFNAFTADIAFSPDDLPASSVVVAIDMASVDTGADDRDATIRSPDLFDVKTWPQGRFAAQGFRKTADGFEAVATLTMRDVTREVVMPFTLTITEGGGILTAKAQGELRVNRLDYGVGQGQWRDTGTVADEVVITFDITATRPVE